MTDHNCNQKPGKLKIRRAHRVRSDHVFPEDEISMIGFEIEFNDQESNQPVVPLPQTAGGVPNEQLFCELDKCILLFNGNLLDRRPEIKWWSVSSNCSWSFVKPVEILGWPTKAMNYHTIRITRQGRMPASSENIRRWWLQERGYASKMELAVIICLFVKIWKQGSLSSDIPEL